jgi:ABC-type antimicrobial peptide transport system permease subunit
VNELVLALAPGADPAVVERELRRTLVARLPDVGVTITRKADEDVHRVLCEDARSDQRMVSVFAWLLLVGAALASFNLVSRVVESQRREIGVGMALGVTPAKLAIRPLLFAAEIAPLGVAVGIGVGLVFNGLFRSALQDLLALPAWETPLLPGVYVRAAALGLAAPLLAAAYPVLRAVRMPPVAAIRVGPLTAASVGLAPLLERLRLPLSSIARMPFRNLARTPRRTLMVNTTSIATEERRREHATMLAFGVPPTRTLRLAIVENALIGALGTIVGLGLGLAVLGWIINVVSRDTYPELGMPVMLSPTSVAVAAALGIVVVALAPLVSWRRLTRVDVPATLRVVE